MENQSNFKKILSKNIYILLGLAIFFEIIWAVWTISKPASFSVIKKISQTQESSEPTTVSLSASQTTLKVGEKVKVEISISSNKKTDGTDLVITYNPKLLSVETVGVSKNPVQFGTIYRDYPLNSLESSIGRITVSGITDSPGGVLANGLFGTIVFQAKSAGLANIKLDFNQGVTTDSNVIESGTGRDLLFKVNNLQIKILP